MTDLQISLIVLAILCIGAVWAYNKFQERRQRKLLAARFAPRRGDILFDGKGNSGGTATPSSAIASREPSSRSEPGFDRRHREDAVAIEDVAAREPREVASAGLEPTIHMARDDDVEGQGSDVEPASIIHPVIDPGIHAVVTLETESQVSGERVLSCLHAFRRAGKQPVSFVGVSGDVHETIHAGERYQTILVAVQLANRSGPLNEIEWSEFVASLQHAAEQIPASCEVPDMMETTARARALDALCVPLDAQIGINLASQDGAWSAEQVAALARQYGLVLRSDGRFHALGEHGATLFVLQNGDGAAFRADNLAGQATSRLTLLLDVPRAPRAQNPYDRLVELAGRLGAALNAAIVDDQSRTLTPAALASIERQIEPVYAKLEAAGMPAGSPRALALFG